MKKIMFNDRYGLTAAVLQGHKTMTRRIVPTQYVPMIEDGLQGAALIEAQRHGDAYRENEIVAVAQSYKDTGLFDIYRGPEDTKGWSNKLFVRADLMPHQIQITDINIEHLQDITDEDCLKEGIGYNNEVGFENGCYYFNDYEGFKTPKNAFCTLINRINGKSSWEINPFVFAYSFKLIK